MWRMDETTQSGTMIYLGSAVEPTEGSAYLWPTYFMYCVGRQVVFLFFCCTVLSFSSSVTEDLSGM